MLAMIAFIDDRYYATTPPPQGLLSLAVIHGGIIHSHMDKNRGSVHRNALDSLLEDLNRRWHITLHEIDLSQINERNTRTLPRSYSKVLTITMMILMPISPIGIKLN